MTLGQRIPLALFVVGLAPLALLSWQLVGLNREAFELQVRQTQALAARSTAGRISVEVRCLKSSP